MEVVAVPAPTVPSATTPAPQRVPPPATVQFQPQPDPTYGNYPNSGNAVANSGYQSNSRPHSGAYQNLPSQPQPMTQSGNRKSGVYQSPAVVNNTPTPNSQYTPTQMNQYNNPTPNPIPAQAAIASPPQSMQTNNSVQNASVGYANPTPNPGGALPPFPVVKPTLPPAPTLTKAAPTGTHSLLFLDFVLSFLRLLRISYAFFLVGHPETYDECMRQKKCTLMVPAVVTKFNPQAWYFLMTVSLNSCSALLYLPLSSSLLI